MGLGCQSKSTDVITSARLKPCLHASQVSFASLAPGIHFEAATVLLLILSEQDIHIQIEPAE